MNKQSLESKLCATGRILMWGAGSPHPDYDFRSTLLSSSGFSMTRFAVLSWEITPRLRYGNAQGLLDASAVRGSITYCCISLASGAAAMVDAGLYEVSKYGIPKPDVVLGQHTLPARAGCILLSPGPIMTAIDSLDIRIFGKSGHVGRADLCIDPVLIACSAVVRLQSIVNKEVRPEDFAVVVCSSIHGGSAANVIPDFVDFKVTIRSYKPAVHERLVEAVKRTVRAECEISSAPAPRIEHFMHAPPTVNEERSTAVLKREFDAYFGEKSKPLEPLGASEDFSYLAEACGAPYVFWMFGVTDPELWDTKEKEGTLDEIPYNHSGHFTPVMQPAMTSALDAFALAALVFLGDALQM